MSEPKTAEVKVAAIISDDEIARVHGRANFGSMSPREVVNDGVRKAALGYHSGHTQFCILREHGLITGPRSMSHDYSLTKKGKRYARELMHDLLFRPASPPAETGEGGPTCQACGGEIAGWLCQSCDKEFKENDAGRLVFTDDADFAQPVSPSEGEGEDLDLYDDKVQEAISWTMRQWGEALGLKTWTQGDGSETVEGDVGVEIINILTDAGLYDPEDGSFAKLAHPASDQSDTERMRAALKRAKAVLENTAVSNALRMVGAHEIIEATLAEKAADQ